MIRTSTAVVVIAAVEFFVTDCTIRPSAHASSKKPTKDACAVVGISPAMPFCLS